MYNRTFWKDHVVDQHGQVIQQGTPMDQSHFNNAEHGLSDESLADSILRWKTYQDDYDTISEVRTATLSMNSGQPWPFNNTPTTIALQQLREHTDYGVDIEVTEYSGGLLGNIRVADRAMNGFKLIHDGSATTVKVVVRITGGMVH